MSFFPLIKINKLEGFCTLHNFPPNNWEPVVKSNKKVWAIYSDGKRWITNYLGDISLGSSKKYSFNDLFPENKKNIPSLVLLQFRKTNIGNNLEFLPFHEFKLNKVPQWRATVGFSKNDSETSYQGEIEPFPSKASLLTFHPFIQYKNINNYFLFLNIQKSPSFQEEIIEIYEANSKKLIDEVKVLTNNTNVIPLDKYNFRPDELPVFVCRSIGGVPFGLGIGKNNRMLSLEHTHPPASFAVHGERYRIQGEIKRKWFSILKNNK